jgi:la-related protein 1
MQKQKKADQAAEAKGRKVASNGTSSGPGDVAGKQGAPGSSSSPKKSVTHVTPASGTTGGKKNRSGSVSNTLETGKKSKASGNKGERPGQDAAINKLVDPVLRKVEEDAFETTNGSRIEMAATGQKKSATEAGVSSSDGVSTLPEASTINSTKPSSADRGRSHPLNLTSSKAETTPASSATMASQSQHSQISYGRGGSSGTPSTRGSRGGRGARGGRGGGAGQAGPGRSHSEQGSPLTSPPNGRSPSLPGHTATQSYPRRSGDYQKTQSSASFGLPSPYYGVPYHYPVMTGGFVPPADGNLEAYGQAAYAGGAAPFPRPVTQISGLDSLRSFILGQLEYYFSMQNLAMDFFLRQQVSRSSQRVKGWIRITDLFVLSVPRWTTKVG